MILVIGGEGSGKRSFVRGLGYADKDMADAVMDERPVIFHLEQLVARAPEGADELAERLLEKDIVICDEVGSGVIPVERAEMVARESTGRLCILLAKHAEAVVRMVCGIPAVIKGTLEPRETPERG